MPPRKQVTYSQRPNHAARSAHALSLIHIFDVHIQTLRQKLAAAVEGADAYIQTVRGVGYCVKQP